ncbi:MAG: hypothetical protein CL605_08955 [Altibacter sp.]|nr:hypothetical protein [Altibacter sp.]
MDALYEQGMGRKKDQGVYGKGFRKGLRKSVAINRKGMHIPSNKYLKAKKKVQAIKRFYSHLIVYLLVNAGLLFFRIEWAPFLFSQQDAAFISWLNWNTFGITFFWGLGLLFHALSVFVVKFKFLKKWEERKIKELIKKEEETMYNRKD